MSFDAIYDFARTFWVVWLMLLFLAIVGWVFWPRHKEKLEAYGRIPLQDDDDRDR